MSRSGSLIVFRGPSATCEDLAPILPEAVFLPPVKRDDVYRAREDGGSVFLILDGNFMHSLAVSPREIIDVIRDGALVFGSSSMGALRAAECWPAGMRGAGVITRLFRSGRLNSDDEVAVTTDPDRDFSATSVALINVRFAASRAVRRKLIDRKTANSIVDAAQALYFPDRLWPVILRQADVSHTAPSLQSFLENFDLKKTDALRAAREVARALQSDPGLADQHRRHAGAPPFSPRERYPGHDRDLGLESEKRAVELTQWLFGTGRYQPYIWALAAGEPELGGVVQAEERREALAGILSRRLAAIDIFAPEVWCELDFMDELDAELMRWHAYRTLADPAADVDPAILERVREETAIAHGLVDWETLEEEVVNDRLFNAIPVTWINDACLVIARARSCNLP